MKVQSENKQINIQTLGDLTENKDIMIETE